MTEVRCNLHTHTVFCDGDNTPEEMLISALEKGCHTLGFSSHSFYGEHDTEGCLNTEKEQLYRKEVNRLKKKYADKINILLGIEQDLYSPPIQNDYDYVIGSVHYIKKDGVYIPVDLSYEALKKGIDEHFGGNSYALVKKYYETVAEVASVTHCDISGHFDIVTKYNDGYSYIDEDSREYQNYALTALDTLLDENIFIEVNTGDLAKGRKKCPYPAPFIVKRVVEKKGKLILSSDCHNKNNIFACFDEAEKYLLSLGVRELWIHNGDSYLPLSIK